MDNSDFQRIQHIRECCEDVARAVKRFGAEQEIFLSDVDYYKSVSMSIMQIGELSVGLSDDFKTETENQMQWALIRGMRNMFAHTYAKMDKITIWDVATRDIPNLQHFCDNIIEKNVPERDRVIQSPERDER